MTLLIKNEANEEPNVIVQIYLNRHISQNIDMYNHIIDHEEQNVTILRNGQSRGSILALGSPSRAYLLLYMIKALMWIIISGRYQFSSQYLVPNTCNKGQHSYTPG